MIYLYQIRTKSFHYFVRVLFLGISAYAKFRENIRIHSIFCMIVYVEVLPLSQQFFSLIRMISCYLGGISAKQGIKCLDSEHNTGQYVEASHQGTSTEHKN